MKAVWMVALVVAAAFAVLPRFLSQQPHADAVVTEKAIPAEAVVVTDYCPTLAGLRTIAEIYTTTNITVDVDQLDDPLENLRAETGCSLGAVHYPRHFAEYERIRLPPENLELVIIDAWTTEGDIPNVYALIEQTFEEEVVASAKTDFLGLVSPKGDLEQPATEAEPVARKVSFGPT